MSGDVQPRKRKDKRRKKDELGVEEPRGTAAVFGEGDVLMHSYHEHGTGGHWCAKIIFFSLLAVLVTLIGLIILENRGLSELEANAVESRYSGVLDGWIEDAHDDDHHDEHTLELKHHTYEDIHDDNDDELDHDEESEDEDHSEEHDDEEDIDDEELDEQTNVANDVSEEENEQNIYDEGYYHKDNSEEQETELDGEEDEDDNDSEEDDEDERNIDYEKFNKYHGYQDDDDEENDDIDSETFRKEEIANDDSEENLVNYHKDITNDDETNDLDDDDDDDEITSVEQGFDETKTAKTLDSYEKESNKEIFQDDEQDEADDDDAVDEEIEKIEREVVDDEEQDISNEDNDEIEKELGDEVPDEDDDDDGSKSPFEPDDITEPPVVEHITVPSGKPFVELDDETSTEKSADTLAEEEEYERRQEQLRQQKQESSSQMWLKVVVGGALLVATHAVIRRSTAPRDTPEVEDNSNREDTPSLVDRRMTLIPNETTPLVPHEPYEPAYEEPVQKVVSEIKSVQSTPITKHESDEEEESELLETEVVPEKVPEQKDKELYSDDEDFDDEQEIVEEEKESAENVEKDAEESEPEEMPDDVEIIDDDQIEEEIEEEDEDEEEISDVDDTELLSRLEAKYGRLPEPERPGQKHKDGGDSLEDEWPGEPGDQYWRQQLDQAEREIRQGEWTSANGRLAAAELANSGRARWLAARSLDAQAEAKRDNALLTRAISSYLHLLKMHERLSDRKLREVAARALDRIQFRGNYHSAEPVYRLLIRRFPNEVSYRNNLTVSFLMANRADLASDVLKETLKLWPDDRIALAHYAFVLKTNHNKLEESVALFRRALENDEGPACEPRFYYHLGDALLLLKRFDEAHEVHKRGAKHGHFLSPAQRSLYNVERLKSRPWWRVEETPYVKLAQALEESWRDILKEGEAAKALYEKEKEGLKEKGEWSQLDIFVRGQEIPGRCERAPITCSIVKAERAASNCRRGQVKFSSMEPGTHVRPHVGPTNCRLRMHLGLSNTKDTYIRVDQEIRQWQTGKVLLFDDSFEHEVWHNGTGARLVLIVDVWHPDLAAAERRQLPAI